MAAPVKVKYSTDESDIGNAKDFPWEYPVPDNGFWNDLDWKMGKDFLTRFSEMERKVIDPQLESQATLPRPEKLELLRKLLKDKLAVKEAAVAPNKLIDADNQVWRGLISAIGSTYRLEGNKTEELKHLKLFNAQTTGLPNTHYLAALLEETGQYDEAIELAKPITTNHDATLGPDSPQAHGSRRTLAKALWKQGKREEAEAVIKEIQENIKASASGKYAAYQVEEQRILDDFVKELQA